MDLLSVVVDHVKEDWIKIYRNNPGMFDYSEKEWLAQVEKAADALYSRLGSIWPEDHIDSIIEGTNDDLHDGEFYVKEEKPSSEEISDQVARLSVETNNHEIALLCKMLLNIDGRLK